MLQQLLFQEQHNPSHFCPLDKGQVDFVKAKFSSNARDAQLDSNPASKVANEAVVYLLIQSILE